MATTGRSTHSSGHPRAASAATSALPVNDSTLHPRSDTSAVTSNLGPQLPAVASSGPSDHFPTVQFIVETAWPKDLCLDRSKSNWEEWSLQMTLIADRHSFTDWLDGSFPQPDVTTDAKGHHAWRTND
jgi:hypothetical protein